jgi:hypothetical protein
MIMSRGDQFRISEGCCRGVSMASLKKKASILSSCGILQHEVKILGD